MSVRPKSKDMKPGTVLRRTWIRNQEPTPLTLARRLSDGDGWEFECGGAASDGFIDNPDHYEVVSVPDEPDTPAPYPLAEGEVLTTAAEAVRCGWEWRFPDEDFWGTGGPGERHEDFLVIARPKPPRMVPVMLAEDVVRGWCGRNSLDAHFLAVDDACRDAVAKLDGEAPDA